jgi:hypothetical protein
MKLRNAALALVLGTFALVTLTAGAFAQIPGKGCGPNSNKCKLHGEACKC